MGVWVGVLGAQLENGQFQVELAVHEFTNRVLHLASHLPEWQVKEWRVPDTIMRSEQRLVTTHLGCQLLKEQVIAPFGQLEEAARRQLLASFDSELAPLTARTLCFQM